MITEEEQGKLDEDENNHAQVEEENKHKSSEVEVSENICDAADENGLFQQRKSGGNSNQEFPAMQNEGSDSLRTSFSISHEVGLVVMNSIRFLGNNPDALCLMFVLTFESPSRMIFSLFCFS
ncbi:ankyrin repeat domain-containing protein 26-like [Bubalus bubalis]|uniref:ankyrin repeat domain-containing protein 26-like n=1 Tax=Bubalus bubalis TaxID=89462 RepID=UPI001D123C1D|nr:ankyrin repeat domain-containing protein 26-like [Bubalus bubalis]